MLVVEDLHKAYDRHVAVAGLSFRVEPGQVLGLVGPNGAGKTTTLRAIAGIHAPSRGSISVAGHDVVADPVAAKARLAYVPDDPQLFDALTVREHLAFAAAAYRVDDWQEKAESLIATFELSSKVHTPAEELSRGMRQKLAIASAYLFDPAVILLDEPLTGLDPRAIRRLKETIVQRAEAGAAVVVSSHLLAMVEDLCSHLLVLAEGEARFHGEREGLRHALDAAHEDASLEDLFFRATEQQELVAD